MRFLVGWHLAATRMHSNLRQMFHGWGRIFSGTSRRSPWRILEAILFFLVTPIVYPALVVGVILAAHGRFDLLAAAALNLADDDRLSGNNLPPRGNPRRYALLYPIASPMMIAIFCFALRMCYTEKLEWRTPHVTDSSSS